MAKMFYTLDEAKAALGKNEEEIKQYTREGKLREFRDGPRLMFKADQIEALKGSVGPDSVNLGPSDSGSPIGLADTKGGSAPGISLSEISGSGLGSGIGGAGAGSGMMNLKDDTALAADLGLSGSMGGVPSPTGGGSAAGLSGTSGGTRVGINVFGEEPPERVDPMAQTSISPSMGSGADLSLDAVGSGSGLLDLTRESDDTSLGSVLDELGPGARRGTESGVGMAAPEMEEMPEPRGGVVRTAGPITMERPDPWAPAMGGAALGAAAVVVFGIFALMSTVSGTWPQSLQDIYEKGWSIWVITAIALVLPVIFGLGGLFLGKLAR